MSAASDRWRARKRADCEATGHEHAVIVIVNGRPWCKTCRWPVSTPTRTLEETR